MVDLDAKKIEISRGYLGRILSGEIPVLSARKTLDDYGVEAKLFTPTDHMITGIVHGPAIFCETRTKLVFADAAERDQAISNLRAVARSETRIIMQRGRKQALRCG